MAENVFIGTRWMWLETCCHSSCKTVFAMSDEIHAASLQRREKFSFYCPNGHEQWYVTGETEVEKMRRERDAAVQRVAQWQDYEREARERAERAERRVAAAKGQVTKLKKRASNGVCPCCNRTFADLARHMAGKHPGFVAEPQAADLVVN